MHKLIKVEYSKKGKRFLTKYEMGMIKREDAIYNSQVKRGEIVSHGTGMHSICQCGSEGCIIFLTWDSKEYPKPTRQELKALNLK